MPAQPYIVKVEKRLNGHGDVLVPLTAILLKYLHLRLATRSLSAKTSLAVVPGYQMPSRNSHVLKKTKCIVNYD